MNSAVAPSIAIASAVEANIGSMRLDECRKGAQVRIVGLQPQTLFGSQDEQVTLRLKELGFLPGAQLKIIGFGLLGS